MESYSPLWLMQYKKLIQSVPFPIAVFIITYCRIRIRKRTMNFLVLVALFSATFALPSPSKVFSPRGPSQCGAFTSIATGPFTIYANEWGGSTTGTTGSQCSYIDSLSSSNSLAWHTTWNWNGSSSQVKSFTNVETRLSQKAVSEYTSIPTSWTWSYTGTDLACNGT